MIERHRILYRYIIREFLKVFGLGLSSLITIYVVVLFFQKMTYFTKYNAPFHLIFEYLLFKTPEVTFKWTLPYSVLFATVLTLGTFARHSEITAFKAGGISLYRLTLPLFLIGLIISVFSFLGNEYLVPITDQKTRHLLSVEVRKEHQTSFFKNYKIWLHTDQWIYNIQLVDPEKKMLKGVTMYEFDDRFQCIRRVDAQEAKWLDGKWWLYQGATREFDETGSIQMVPFRETDSIMKEDWESFEKIEKPSEDMSYRMLQNYIKKIQASGYDATRYLVSLYAKLSYPLLNLIMMLIGIPFALKTGRSGGVALSIGVSVLIGFAYGVTFYVFVSFGKSGILSPMLAAWIPTLLFGLSGVFTLMSIRQ